MEKAVFLRGWAKAMSSEEFCDGWLCPVLLLSLTLKSSGWGGSEASALLIIIVRCYFTRYNSVTVFWSLLFLPVTIVS